jgi:serine/threonine-protein kinase
MIFSQLSRHDMIGQTIAHYKILEKLGQGGMGVVYKAEDTKLDRLVALKFLPAHLAASAQDKARFVQEAKAASAINHPNICTIYSIDEHDGQMFIVMEYVDGVTLRQKEGTIGYKQAIDIGIQIADGLAAAHEKGIVHRDIKPENIMIRKDGITQIMDFGLAKLRASGSKITRLTKEGSTVGTAGYMSPEQVQGQETDHRSDIFSYGVVLYEMLTGQLPFKGVHETALAYEIVNVDPPPMSSIKPELDPSLDAIVLECLEKDVTERAQGIKQISVDLKRQKRESSRQRASRVTAARPAVGASRLAPAAAPERKSWPQYVGYILAGVLALALAFMLWGPRKDEVAAPRRIIRSSLIIPPEAALTQNPIALSPDGKSLVFTGAANQLFLHRMDEATSQPIPEAFGIQPVFSPDGQWVAYVSGSLKIRKVSVTGGAPETVYQDPSFIPGLWWTPDNMILFGTYSSGLSKISISGGTPVPVTMLDSAAGEISHRLPQLLPDGKSVLYTAKTKDMASVDDGLIVAQRLETHERKLLVKGGWYGRYLPSGHLVYARGNAMFAVRFDAERLEVIGSPVRLEDGGVWNNQGAMGIAFSSDGVAVFAPPAAYRDVNDKSLGWLDRSGVTHPLYDTLRNYGAARLSPDGQKIAMEVKSANDDIWVYDISRGLLSRLTFGWGNNNLPIWSPDGKYVFYSAEKGQSASIYRKPWDGSGKEERLTTSSNPQSPVSVTPDGKFLSFNEGLDIWILPLDSSGAASAGKPYPFVQTPVTEFGGNFSPDGKWMTYISNESGKPEVYALAFPSREGKRQVSIGGGVASAFSRDGKQLFYFTRDSSVFVVDVKAGSVFDCSAQRKVLTIPKKTGMLDISLDGTQFLVRIWHPKQDPVAHLDLVTDWFEVVKGRFAETK